MAPLEIPNALPPESTPLLADLHKTLAKLGTCPPLEAVKAAVKAAGAEFEPRLIERGLLVGSWWGTSAPWIILAPSAATLALGIAKIHVGMSRGKNVGFLVLGCAVLFFISLLFIAKKPRRTRQGDAIVRSAWTRFRESGQQRARRDQLQSNRPCDPLALSLIGTTALVGTAHASLISAVRKLRKAASDSGGCGGGGCGGDGGGGDGGGGGCGGCGGGGD